MNPCKSLNLTRSMQQLLHSLNTAHLAQLHELKIRQPYPTHQITDIKQRNRVYNLPKVSLSDADSKLRKLFQY